MNAEPAIIVTSPARTPFVGRTAELAVLRSRAQAARAGDPTIVLLTGDAGVGKSRLIDEALRRGERDGLQTCYGRFIESGSSPFLPFVSALIPKLRGAGLATASGAGEDGLLQFGTAKPEGAPGAAAFLVELGRRTLELARKRPLLFAIDDVQWATAAETDAIEHLAIAIADAQRAGPAPIALLLGMRAPEAGTPAFALLNRLHREPSVLPVELGGFDEAEAEAFIRASLGEPASRQFAAALKQSADGNPLFLGEFLWTLARQRALTHRRGVVESRIEPEELALPREVTAAVEARAREASPELARVLAIAALDGDEISLARLSVVAERPEEFVIELIDQAITAGFVTEDAGTPHFTHPIVRHVFANRGAAVRRRRTHIALARAIGTEGGATLGAAAHFLSAQGDADPVEAGPVFYRAAEEALRLSAWAEAGRYFEAAIRSRGYLELVGPAAACRVLHQAAFAHYRNMDVALSRERFLEAVQRARDLGDIDTWAGALVGWIRSHVAHGGVQPGRMLDRTLLDEFLIAAENAPLARARVEVEWSEALFAAREPSALELATQALAVGLEEGDELLSTHAAVARGLALLQALRVHEALEAFEASLRHASRLEDRWYDGWALTNIPQCLLMLGRLAEADAACVAAIEHGRMTHDWAVAATGLAYRVVCAVLRGDFVVAEEAASECDLMVARSDYAWAAPAMLAALAWGRALRDDSQGATDAAEAFQTVVGRFNSWTLAQLVGHLGANPDGDHQALVADRRFGFWQSRADSFTVGLFAARVELARHSGIAELAVTAGEAVRGSVADGASFTLWPSFSSRRIGALAAALAGDCEQASRDAREALREAEAAGAVTEVALAWGDVAEGCWAAGDDAGAASAIQSGHATAASAGLVFLVHRYQSLAAGHGVMLGELESVALYPDGLEELEVEVLSAAARDMAPASIAQALVISERTAKERLEAAMRKSGAADSTAIGAYLAAHGLVMDRYPAAAEYATAARAAGLQVLMFSDIVGSTPLNRALGDARYVELLSKHDDAVAAAVGRRAGRVIKNTGDGAFAAFPSARGALEAARELQAIFPMALSGAPEAKLQVRIGLHAGEPVARSDDLFGLSVTLAKRICDRADDGGLLVSDSVRDLCEGSEFRFRERGRFTLKGIGRRVRLFELIEPGNA